MLDLRGSKVRAAVLSYEGPKATALHEGDDVSQSYL
jgi:hypothetical protein